MRFYLLRHDLRILFRCLGTWFYLVRHGYTARANNGVTAWQFTKQVHRVGR